MFVIRKILSIELNFVQSSTSPIPFTSTTTLKIDVFSIRFFNFVSVSFFDLANTCNHTKETVDFSTKLPKSTNICWISASQHREQFARWYYLTYFLTVILHPKIPHFFTLFYPPYSYLAATPLDLTLHRIS